MKPISLTLKGIYSYKEEQTINFKHLTESGLFGIFGEVGSGKSVILEAITYALYGETVRMNKQQNRSYNMMNLLSNEFHIDFIFVHGSDGKEIEYRFTASAKRNKKKFEDVKTIDRKAYKKIDEQWMPLESIDGKLILNLSYDNFKRTVIIPQNKFQEFLELSGTDKRSMMEEIFDLSKYNLYKKIDYLDKINNEKINQINAKISQIGDVSNEVLENEERNLNEVKKLIEQNDEILDKFSTQDKKYDWLKNIFNQIDANNSRLENLNSKKQFYLEKSNQLKNYEKCYREFKFMLSSIENKKIEYSSKVSSIKSDESDRIKLEVSLESLLEEFNLIKTKYENKNDLIQKVNDFNCIIEINNLISSLNRKKINIDKIKRSIENYDFEIKNINEQLNVKINEVENLNLTARNLQTLSEIKYWFNLKNNFMKNLDDTKVENKFNLNEILKIEEELKNTIENAISNGLIKNNEIKISNQISDKKKSIEIEIIHIDKEINLVTVQQKLKEFTQTLSNGEACPLCGSLEHPKPLVTNDLQNNYINDNKKIKCKERIKSLDLLFEKLKELHSNKKIYLDSNIRLNEKINKQQNDLKNHDALFVWSDYKLIDEYEIINNYKIAKLNSEQIEICKSFIEKLRNDIDKKNQNKKQDESEILKYGNELITIETKCNTLKEVVKLSNFQEVEMMNNTQIEIKIKSLNQEIISIDNNFEIKEKQLKEVEIKKNVLDGQIISQKTMLEDIEFQLKEEIEKLNEKLIENNFNNVEEVNVILNKNLNVEVVRKEIEQFKLDINTCEKNKLDFFNQSNGEVYNSELHEKLKFDLDSVTKEQNELRVSEGSLKSTISNYKKAIIEVSNFNNNLENLNIRAFNLNLLKSHFVAKGKGFLDYIISVYLNQLCDSANERFYKMTSQNYKLVVTEDNNFEVKDFLNGGKVRGAFTLSGGQKFQAALSLALALSGSIQTYSNSKQNSFFLDEGFGSLDKSTLENVFDTLKSLLNENRIVGVISHVEEVKQEIDVYLKIRKDKDKGSIIETSWK